MYAFLRESTEGRNKLCCLRKPFLRWHFLLMALPEIRENLFCAQQADGLIMHVSVCANVFRCFFDMVPNFTRYSYKL